MHLVSGQAFERGVAYGTFVGLSVPQRLHSPVVDRFGLMNVDGMCGVDEDVVFVILHNEPVQRLAGYARGACTPFQMQGQVAIGNEWLARATPCGAAMHSFIVNGRRPQMHV